MEDDNESSDEDENEDEIIEKSKEISKNGRCGKGIGSCKKGECCSKYGWCGKTGRHCNLEEGCQSEFGECYPKMEDDNESIDEDEDEDEIIEKNKGVFYIKGRCGKDIGSCKKGECCSKYGWCGNTGKHCKIEEGCQSEFGECISRTSTPAPYIGTSTGKCGKGYGSCRKGYCCSKFGWCGKSKEYCEKSKGCQFKFGKCW